MTVTSTVRIPASTRNLKGSDKVAAPSFPSIKGSERLSISSSTGALSRAEKWWSSMKTVPASAFR